jgi:hypothetical protein
MFFVAVTKRVNRNSGRSLSDAGKFRKFIFIQGMIEAALTVLHYASLHAGLSTQQQYHCHEYLPSFGIVSNFINSIRVKVSVFTFY